MECKSCKNKIEENVKHLQCKLCTQFFHPQCAGVSNTNLTALLKIKGAHWLCDQCNSEDIFDKLRELKDFSAQHAEMNRKIDTLTAKVEAGSSAPNPIVDPILRKNEIRDIIREKRDMESRKLNLCVFNFPQSENDKSSFIDLCTTKLNLGHDELSAGMVETRRIDSAPMLDNSGRPRPSIMIVSLSTYALKTKILKNAPKLRDYVPKT